MPSQFDMLVDELRGAADTERQLRDFLRRPSPMRKAEELVEGCARLEKSFSAMEKGLKASRAVSDREARRRRFDEINAKLTELAATGQLSAHQGALADVALAKAAQDWGL